MARIKKKSCMARSGENVTSYRNSKVWRKSAVGLPSRGQEIKWKLVELNANGRPSKHGRLLRGQVLWYINKLRMCDLRTEKKWPE